MVYDNIHKMIKSITTIGNTYISILWRADNIIDPIHIVTTLVILRIISSYC